MTGSAEANQNDDAAPKYTLASRMLGGQTVIRRPIRNEFEAHLRILEGLPIRALVRITRGLSDIPASAILEVIGISERTFRRREELAEKNPSARLSTDEGSRLWKFAELLATATETLGSQEAAEQWLNSPQIGLDGRRPIELLTTAPGAELVEDLLLRMEYGVYT